MAKHNKKKTSKKKTPQKSHLDHPQIKRKPSAGNKYD